MKNQTVTETQQAVFSIELTHSDVKGSQWIKNGVEIHPSDKFDITIAGMVHTLKINNCNTQDESVYGFKLGKLSANARLNVESMCLFICQIYSYINLFPVIGCISILSNLFCSYQNCEETKGCDFSAGCHCFI